MMQIAFNEIETWPDFLQKVFSYLKKATVVVPVMAVLRYSVYSYIMYMYMDSRLCYTHIHTPLSLFLSATITHTHTHTTFSLSLSLSATITYTQFTLTHTTHTDSGLIYYYAALSHALKEVNKDLRLQLRVVSKLPNFDIPAIFFTSYHYYINLLITVTIGTVRTSRTHCKRRYMNYTI